VCAVGNAEPSQICIELSRLERSVICSQPQGAEKPSAWPGLHQLGSTDWAPQLRCALRLLPDAGQGRGFFFFGGIDRFDSGRVDCREGSTLSVVVVRAMC